MSYRGFTLVLAGVLVAMCAGARATTIQFDSNSSAAGTSSWSHTVGSGSDRILVVGFAAEGSDTAISSITYGGVGLTEAAGTLGFIDPGGNMQTTVLYYLLDPNSGTANIVITLSGGGFGSAIGGGISLENVKQQAPEDANHHAITSPDPTTISTSVTTVTDGAWVVDVVGSGQPLEFTPTGMDERYQEAASSSQGAGSTKFVASAGTATMTWSSNETFRMSHSVAAFAPVPEPAPLFVMAAVGLPVLLRRRQRRS